MCDPISPLQAPGSSPPWRSLSRCPRRETDRIDKADEFATPLVLAIDIGTSRLRAQLFDRNLTPLPGLSASRPQPVRQGEPGQRMEIDPDAVLANLVDALAELLALINPALSPRQLPIAAVGVSAIWHSLLAIDTEGRPLTPALLWGDQRAIAQAHDLRRAWDAEAYHRRTGAFVHPSFPAVWLRWWYEQASLTLLWRQVHAWMTLPDYLFLQLFGPPLLTSFSLASGTGLLSYASSDWDDETLAALHLAREQLPRLAEIEWVRAGLRSPFREQLPRLARTPFLLAAGDGACDNLGQHAVNVQHPAVMVASSAAARLLLPAAAVPTPPPSLFAYRLTRDLAVIGGALSNGGNLLDWCRRTLLLPDDPEAIQEALASLPPAAGRLQVSPDLAGRRGPDWAVPSGPITSAGGGGTIAGLTLQTRPIEILQAMLEMVAQQLAVIRRNLISAQLLAPGRPPTVTCWQAAGGALVRWPAWAELIANVFGEPLALAPTSETSLRGAARLALWASGLLSDLTDPAQLPPPGPARLIEPDLARHRLYAQLWPDG